MHLALIFRIFQHQNTLLFSVIQTNPENHTNKHNHFQNIFSAFPTVLNFPIPKEMGESEYWKVPFGSKGNKADKFSNTHKLH
jgi:hypothetical protein